MIITRGFSLTNFVIGSSALAFQTLVLYPWHHQLDDDFHRMNSRTAEMLREGEVARIAELRKIQEELAELRDKVRQSRRGWFW